MIEVIYKEEKKEAQGNEEFFRLPKNIRQIGESGSTRKIYIEDYVCTFLNRAAAAKKEQGKVAVLLGQANWQDGVSYLFIRGALLAEEMDAAPEKLAFTDEIWTALEEKEKEFFPELEVVGWFFSMADLKMEITDSLRRAHLNYFGGGEKVLFLMEPLEKEEAFFLYENGSLHRQPGYYIYYEKNPQMQEYMLHMKETLGITEGEADSDRAVASFRKLIGTKKEEQPQERGHGTGLFYGAAAAAAVAALAVGVHALNGYEKLGGAAKELLQASSFSVFRTETASAPSDGDKTSAAETAHSAARDTQPPKRSAAADSKPAASAPSAVPSAASASALSAAPSAASPGTEMPLSQKDAAAKSTDTFETAERPKPAETEAPETPAPAKDLPEAEKKDESGTPVRETAGDSVHSSYTVQLGDSLYKISTEKYGDMGMIREICELNDISVNDIIYPGQIILLP